MEEQITFTVITTPARAQAFAQFVKRAGYSDYRKLADSSDEAYYMMDASGDFREALAEAGYAPR